MKTYKIYLDLSMIIHRLKKVRLDEYNSHAPIVFIIAKDPDQACNVCYTTIVEKIMRSKKLTDREMLELSSDLLHDMRIKRVYNP